MEVYENLLKKHGPQGWWPTGGEYHKEDYDHPNNDSERFEIIIGAVLTQNTAWTNVEKALVNMRKEGLIEAKRIITTNVDKLKEAIRPAGYFNQKAVYLKNIAEFYISLKGRTPERKELLGVKGVGPETADSILLYAYKQPEFVVDAYTKRVFARLGIIEEKATYNEVKKFFENSLPKDHKLYNEYHALIVEHGKKS